MEKQYGKMATSIENWSIQVPLRTPSLMWPGGFAQDDQGDALPNVTRLLVMMLYPLRRKTNMTRWKMDHEWRCGNPMEHEVFPLSF